MRVALAQGAYQAKSVIADAQRCINLYPEKNPEDAPFPLTHYLTPGTDVLSTGTSLSNINPVRCTYRTSAGDLYVVVGNTVYFVDPAFVFTSVGTVGSASTPVSMADNGIAILLCDGSPNLWAINISTSGIPGTFGSVTGSSFYGADRVDYIDTFFILNRPGTNDWYISLSESSYAMLTGASGSILSGAITTPGSAYSNGTFLAQNLTGGSGSGAQATIVVSGGLVVSVTVTTPGIGYAIGDVLSAALAGGSGFTWTVGTIGGGAFDATDIATKNGYPDPIQGVIVMHREIWLIGALTTEIWYNAGAADFAFQILPGTFVEHGCIAKYSICRQDLSVYWLSQDEQGQTIVLKGADYQAKRISTFAIEQVLSTYPTVSDAIGFTYQQEGHTFLVMSFPSANATWVYDESMQLWHQRAWCDNNGNLNRHRANLGCNVYNKNVIGDWQNGNLYALDLNTYVDNVDGHGANPDGSYAIQRIRSFPHLLNQSKRVSYKQFVADMDVGQQLVPETSSTPSSGYLEQNLKSICLIPASGEFVYATQVITDTTGAPFLVNNHTGSGADALVALSQLQSRFPSLESVTVVVGWFGTDLRIDQCQIQPGVETLTRTTTPLTWYSGGVQRAQAHLISTYAGGPAYGGTPSDDTIVEMVAQLKSMGYKVGLYPFIFMDIPSGNSLPNPYGGVGQNSYPWRGEITCNPAIGQGGTPNKTAAAATQVNTFVGTAIPANFSINGMTGQITYSGTSEWSFRKFILYYAYLAASRCGGVDYFLMGSEMPAATSVRSSTTDFPFVDALVSLAADCESTLNSDCQLSYAANWSEYFGYQPADGSNDVWFNLDPLWASTSIDFIGIDMYQPIADWRQGNGGIDATIHGYGGPYERAYIQANIGGGENFDWYYASQSARDNQVRTNITDFYGSPWVFQSKNFEDWWSNLHYNRPGGVPVSTATSWIAQSKPIRFVEFGCGAVNLGSNQPNKFFDPKSSESGLPYYSNGARDDLNQRVALEAMLSFYSPTGSNNPISTVYEGNMLDRLSAWTWDARPYPQFPNLLTVWTDGVQYPTGQWLEGRSLNDPYAPLSPTPSPSVSLRWSDTKGITWGNKLEQSLGATGQFLVNIQWRRLGMARDRVFELSWSMNGSTALNGAWLEVESAKT